MTMSDPILLVYPDRFVNEEVKVPSYLLYDLFCRLLTPRDRYVATSDIATRVTVFPTDCTTGR